MRYLKASAITLVIAAIIGWIIGVIDNAFYFDSTGWAVVAIVILSMIGIGIGTAIFQVFKRFDWKLRWLSASISVILSLILMFEFCVFMCRDGCGDASIYLFGFVIVYITPVVSIIAAMFGAGVGQSK